MHIELINPLEFLELDELLLSCEKSSFFHTSSWAKVLCDTYSYTPLYFLVHGDEQFSLLPIMEIKSFLTGKRGVGLPFSDWCEPLLTENVKQQDAWDMLREYGERSGWKYLEIRGGNAFGLQAAPFASYYEHTLDLSQDEEKIYSRLRGSTKRNIKKAARAGVQVSLSSSADSMAEFYRLNCLTRRVHGLPPQPFSFFQNIHETVIKKDHGVLLIGRYQEKAVAASIYFHFGGRVVYKYGASDAGYQHLRPNNLVMWKAIVHYCQRGMTSFSFGRTDMAHEGLRKFKTGWGAGERIGNYYRYDFSTKRFVRQGPDVPGVYSKTFTKLPLVVSRIIGTFLYRHAG